VHLDFSVVASVCPVWIESRFVGPYHGAEMRHHPSRLRPAGCVRPRGLLPPLGVGSRVPSALSLGLPIALCAGLRSTRAIVAQAVGPTCQIAGAERGLREVVGHREAEVDAGGVRRGGCALGLMGVFGTKVANIAIGGSRSRTSRRTRRWSSGHKISAGIQCHNALNTTASTAMSATAPTNHAAQRTMRSALPLSDSPRVIGAVGTVLGEQVGHGER